jgi:hypothetical protein
MAARTRESHSQVLARYVRIVCALLRQANLVLSPRRAVMLLRNVAGVHAARLLDAADADLSSSAFLALRHSLPQRATGEAVNETSVLAAHKEAWKSAEIPEDSPMHVLMAEPDPLHRALAATRCASLGKREFSTVVSDCLATLAPGARHALAAHLFESGAAGRLVAAGLSRRRSGTPSQRRPKTSTRPSRPTDRATRSGNRWYRWSHDSTGTIRRRRPPPTCSPACSPRINLRPKATPSVCLKLGEPPG